MILIFVTFAGPKNIHDNKHPLLLHTSGVLENIPFERIEMGDFLGGGCFGAVYKAKLLPDKNLVACKIVENSDNLEGKMDLEECYKGLLREINAHKEIRSAFICKLFGYSINLSEKKFCIIMEYMINGSLSSIIKKENEGKIKLPFLRKIKMMGDVANALTDIHKKNFIHADLKPDNILVNYEFEAKVSDFGIVKNKNIYEDNNIGSVRYMPKEFFLDEYDSTVDIYSFGLVMYQFFTGQRHEMQSFNLKLPELNSIKVPIIQELIKRSILDNPSKRGDSQFYLVTLRSFVECFEFILKSNDFYDTYKNLSSDQKDYVFIKIYGLILKFSSNKIQIQHILKTKGLSDAEIKNPETDEWLTRFALQLDKIFDENNQNLSSTKSSNSSINQERSKTSKKKCIIS